MYNLTDVAKFFLERDMPEVAEYLSILYQKGVITDATLEEEERSLSGSLCSTFTWSETPQGHGYWSKLYYYLEKEGL